MSRKGNSILAYADAFAGVSGDMFLGALLDAGLPIRHLEAELAGLGMTGYRLEISKQKRGAISATDIHIQVEEKQPQRSWKTIRRLLEQSRLADAVKNKALAVFTELAMAEAKIHGQAMDEVHFHEVGGLDAVIDIVGAVIGLDYFEVEQLISAPLPMPHGWVTCRHGVLPLPAPAVYEILRDTPVFGVDQAKELVTPTGAALVKALSSDFGPLPPMTLARIGYGAGDRQDPGSPPNLFRLVIGTSRTVREAQTVEVIETHLDDWPPEGFPYLTEVLFAQGALDVSLVPIHMKKGRPGFLLRVIAAPLEALPIKQRLLAETSAIGLRFHTVGRMTLPRQTGTVETPWGPVAVKKVETADGPVLYPEYEACRQLARDKNITLRAVYQAVACCPPAEFVRHD